MWWRISHEGMERIDREREREGEWEIYIDRYIKEGEREIAPSRLFSLLHRHAVEDTHLHKGRHQLDLFHDLSVMEEGVSG